MDLLEQPMEAVAFRIYSLPEVAAAAAAAWTCLAAVLWRLRSSTPAGFTLAATKPLESNTSTSLISSTEAERSSEKPPEPTTSSPAPSPKERYTAYYHDSGCVVESDEEEDRDPEDDDDAVYGAWETRTEPFEWEVVRPLVAAAAADEVGRRRSPRALGGSVVRLWDQGAEWRRAGTVSSF